MVDDRSMGPVVVVDDGRSSRGAMRALSYKLEGLVQDGTIPTFQVIQEDEMLRQNAMLAALLASSPPSLHEALDGPPKLPKEEKPLDVQMRLKVEAERKRQRRRAKRARDAARQTQE